MVAFGFYTFFKHQDAQRKAAGVIELELPK
jgi:hypothetical protein